MKKYVVVIESSTDKDTLQNPYQVVYQSYDTWKLALIWYRYYKRIYDKEQLIYYHSKSFWITLQIEERDACDKNEIIEVDGERVGKHQYEFEKSYEPIYQQAYNNFMGIGE